MNDTQKYLRRVVHEIGLELHSTAVCQGVRRTREGTFTLKDALTHHHWTAPDVMQAVRQYHASKKRRKLNHMHTSDTTLQAQEQNTVSQQNDEAAAVGIIQ